MEEKMSDYSWTQVQEVVLGEGCYVVQGVNPTMLAVARYNGKSWSHFQQTTPLKKKAVRKFKVVKVFCYLGSPAVIPANPILKSNQVKGRFGIPQTLYMNTKFKSGLVVCFKDPLSEDFPFTWDPKVPENWGKGVLSDASEVSRKCKAFLKKWSRSQGSATPEKRLVGIMPNTPSEKSCASLTLVYVHDEVTGRQVSSVVSYDTLTTERVRNLFQDGDLSAGALTHGFDVALEATTPLVRELVRVAALLGEKDEP